MGCILTLFLDKSDTISGANFDTQVMMSFSHVKILVV
jgi:hypothetical protein